ncbi:MAG: hypothetical protein HY012_01765, partial [Acidobacteria bacterium]|nr:hypothetical protein [Acidobacteriota bacterium]
SWHALIKYVESGGTLLITGSLERDPRWRITQRLAALGLDAAPQPLTFRQAELDMGTDKLALSFTFEKQQFIEALAAADGETFHELSWGKGRIFVASFPVELAEGLDAAAALYSWVLRRAGIEPPFAGTPPSPGVLVRPVVMQESVLYLFVSESAADEEINLRDKTTGAELRFRLPAQRATLKLLDKHTGKVIAEYVY